MKIKRSMARRFTGLVLPLLAVAAFSLCAAPAARADIVVFDFEGLAPTSPPSIGALAGALTNLVLTQGALTMTLTREGGGRFDILDTTGTYTPSYGFRTLDPFFDNQTPTAFIATFSQAVNSVSIDMGDFAPSDLDNLIVQAYSGPGGTGSLLAQANAICCAVGNGVFVFTTLNVSASGIFSIRFIGGSTTFPNSVFYDNIRVDFNTQATVPEPATVLLLGTGIAGLGAAVRRRRRAAPGND